jgi:hypothetical protein
VNYKGGTYGAAADPSVAYDAKHGEWLISTLPLAGLSESSGNIGDVAVSRSSGWVDVGKSDHHRQDPPRRQELECVRQHANQSLSTATAIRSGIRRSVRGDVLLSVSSDGGQTWGPGLASSDHAGGLGGEPVVQPNGTVIVPFQGGGIDVFSSTNGGASWGKSQVIANIDSHLDAGGIRNPDLPSVGIDGAGNVYRGVVRLPLPHWLQLERHRDEFVGRRQDVERGDTHSD